MIYYLPRGLASAGEFLKCITGKIVRKNYKNEEKNRQKWWNMLTKFFKNSDVTDGMIPSPSHTLFLRCDVTGWCNILGGQGQHFHMGWGGLISAPNFSNIFVDYKKGSLPFLDPNIFILFFNLFAIRRGYSKDIMSIQQAYNEQTSWNTELQLIFAVPKKTGRT